MAHPSNAICRSLPQIDADSVLTSISPGPGTGTGTSTHRMSPGANARAANIFPRLFMTSENVPAASHNAR